MMMTIKSLCDWILKNDKTHGWTPAKEHPTTVHMLIVTEIAEATEEVRNGREAIWFKGDKPFARAILQNGMWRDPALPESVPMLSDLVAPKDKPIVDFMATLGVIGRGLVLPPGAPKQALQILRPAFDRMIKDKTYVADVNKRRLRVLYTPAAEVEKAIKDALDNADEKVVARARGLIFPKK